MGRRSKAPIPKSFESDKPFEKSNDTFASIFRSMILSKAWQSLKPRQRDLYVHCKSEYIGKSKDDLRQFKAFFEQEHITIEQQKLFFTMNWGKVKKGASLYNLYSNPNQFAEDINALIEKGFIDCVLPGADTRRKNLYRFSDRWRKFGEEGYKVPPEYKTISGRGTRRHSISPSSLSSMP